MNSERVRALSGITILTFCVGARPFVSQPLAPPWSLDIADDIAHVSQLVE